jgi:hypothetical protein
MSPAQLWAVTPERCFDVELDGSYFVVPAGVLAFHQVYDAALAGPLATTAIPTASRAAMMILGLGRVSHMAHD